MRWIKEYRSDILIVTSFLLVAIVVGCAIESIELAAAIMIVPASFAVAKFHGALAASRAARRRAEAQAQQARVLALRALRDEVSTIRGLAEYNADLLDRDPPAAAPESAVKLPVAAFEAAFPAVKAIPGDLAAPGPLGSERPLDLASAARHYLTEAYAINALVDLLRAAMGAPESSTDARRGITHRLATRCLALGEILDRLDDGLAHQQRHLL